MTGKYDLIRESLEKEAVTSSLRGWATMGELCQKLHREGYKFNTKQIGEIIAKLEKEKKVISFQRGRISTINYISTRSLTLEQRNMYRAEKGLFVNPQLLGARA